MVKQNIGSSQEQLKVFQLAHSKIVKDQIPGKYTENFQNVSPPSPKTFKFQFLCFK